MFATAFLSGLELERALILVEFGERLEIVVVLAKPCNSFVAIRTRATVEQNRRQ